VIPSRSSLRLPGRLRCFDPIRSSRHVISVLAASLAILMLAPGRAAPALLALLVGVSGALVIARRDRQRPLCTSVLLRSCEVLAIHADYSIVRATLTARGGRVAFLRPGWGLRRIAATGSGTRHVPVVLARDSSLICWQDGSVEVPLEEDAEILGALGIVLRGDDLQVEAIYGRLPDGPSHLLAVRVASNEGAVQSWNHGLMLERPWTPRRRGKLASGDAATRTRTV
jgi:hypothetical protein